MLDHLYTKLTQKIPYKLLILVPILLSVLMLGVVFTKGVPLSIEFQGGMRIGVTKYIDPAVKTELSEKLEALGLKDLDLNIGTDGSIMRIETTSNITSINKEVVIQTIEEYTGNLSEEDIVEIDLPEIPSDDDLDALKEFGELTYNKSQVTITALNLRKDNLEKELEKRYGGGFNITIKEANLMYTSIGPSLGSYFMENTLKALFYGFILIIIIVFFVFRKVIPSVAILLAATCDMLIALGGISILNIKFELASVAALLMLIGYSVDSDILLTTRVLKRREGTVEERIDSAMKTGLTMTATTLAALGVLILVSAIMIQIETLGNIAAILVIGLMGDVLTTWFMNAGILKWYSERPKKIKRSSRLRFKFPFLNKKER